MLHKLCLSLWFYPLELTPAHPHGLRQQPTQESQVVSMHTDIIVSQMVHDHITLMKRTATLTCNHLLHI